MKRLALIALCLIGTAWFVGADALSSRVAAWRAEARRVVAADVPLKNQLAEARQQVDAYAESIIRGEVAADALADRIRETERETVALARHLDQERQVLAALRTSFGASDAVVPASHPLRPMRGSPEEAALRRARAFQSASVRLERRTEDLHRLKSEHAATLDSLEKARAEQMRLGEEVRLLAGELESLEARRAAARTRDGVSAASANASGFALARERIDAVRSALREQSKLLAYYEVERVEALDDATTADLPFTDPALAIDEVLASWPAR